ncbi:MAG: hypothetical protein Q4G68_14990 [Planctomycetia bacterium]|nr:hypothetical protein [Planctomycetia bacterium]
MSEKLLNSFIASVVGCLSAVGTVWFLSSGESGVPATSGVVPAAVGESGVERGSGEAVLRCEQGRIGILETDQIIVRDKLLLVDGKTREPLVEIREGQVQVFGTLASASTVASEIRGQKLQIVRGDPSRAESQVFGELAAGRQQGAYLALLSQEGNHSLNMGFDKAETGFIISQNNVDRSVVAQSIMPKPHLDDQADTRGGVEAVAKAQGAVVR